MTSATSRWAVGLALLTFITLNLANALHKGGDFDVFLEAGDRLSRHAPLYEGSSPGSGIIGPPFQAVFFAPFALLARFDRQAAALAWYALNLVALAVGAWCWTHAATRHTTLDPSWSARWLVLAPLVAIALPLQTNFEHQNLNVMLLAITGAGALAGARGHWLRAGFAFGVAASLKVFPALLLLPLIRRRNWAAATSSAVTLVVLTLVPAVWYGWSAALTQLSQWLALTKEGGWPTRVQNQSLWAALARLFPEAPAEMGLVIIGVGLGVAYFTIAKSRPADDDWHKDCAVALGCAVLLSPIAWDHYWVLFFPAFQATTLAARTRPRGRFWTLAAFWMAALLISGLSRATLGAHGQTIAREWSNSTVGGLMLLAAVGWKTKAG